jgi:hypothetical protein
MFRNLVIGVLPALLLVGARAEAAPPWTVSEVSGDVRLSENGRTRPATKGLLLGSGAVIATAPGARAVLVRGQEFVVISPGSRLRLPAAESPNRIVQMIQEFGSALFKIEKKSTPHFGVQTPYLAAVVKGTTFTVTVGAEDARVRVTEGAVEVSTLDGGAADLLTPGSLAMVGKSDLYRLTVEGKGAKELRSGAAPAGAPVAGAVTVPAPNQASIAKGDNRSARAETVRIVKVIGERSMSLGKATDGLVEGRTAAEHAQGQFNEHSREARAPKADKPDQNPSDDKQPEKGDTEKPDKDEKPNTDKPEKGDKPAEQPGGGPGDTPKGHKPAEQPGGGPGDTPNDKGNKPGHEDADPGKDGKEGKDKVDGGKADKADGADLPGGDD